MPTFSIFHFEFEAANVNGATAYIQMISPHSPQYAIKYMLKYGPADPANFVFSAGEHPGLADASNREPKILNDLQRNIEQHQKRLAQ